MINHMFNFMYVYVSICMLIGIFVELMGQN